ncbi:antiviral reverse transcriptase Drt4 [Alcaligenes faecalis]|uniref:antiviral reverse transcriptase Drt4 n=1 Tax=Alcaligenes faecalis TaxID=511 RepID=UPI003657FC1B
MTIPAAFVYESLLGHNYLPTQRRKKEELPPLFSSVTFTPTAAAPLLTMTPANKARGFDLVEYRATKFNAVARTYAIPHPIAYAQLAKCIADNWREIEPYQLSNVSMIRPRQHADGRLIIMDYENFSARASRMRNLAFNQRYVAKADIASCFPSVYTHAIPWAIVGKAAAKLSTKGGWHNDLDFHARRCVRDETQGIPIGPGTSNIIAEILLSTIDQKLALEFKYFRRNRKNGMSRFIDDYSLYCDSFDTAERFIRRLDEELNALRLRLNPKKTAILTPAMPFGDVWAAELALRLPTGAPIDAYKCTNYLEFATSLAHKHPEGSILKYAGNALVTSDLSASAKEATLDYLLVLAVANPVLLPLLEKLFDDTMIGGRIRHSDRILKILQDGALRHRSDAMSWALYYCRKYNLRIPQTIANAIIKTEDCVALLSLFLTGQHLPLITTWAQTLNKTDSYTLDRYWLLFYQMYLNGHLAASFCSVPAAFTAMKAARVTFVA